MQFTLPQSVRNKAVETAEYGFLIHPARGNVKLGFHAASSQNDQ
jgi:hypothetical protein